MKTIGVIPARYKSSRYPGKPLVKILGKPMIIHVAERVAAALGREHTYIATEDERILHCAEEFGFTGIMTSDLPSNGTARVWEVAQSVKADIYVNIQGDEPMVSPDDIRLIAETKTRQLDRVVNGMCEIGEKEDPASINIPKVLAASDGTLLYMSRLPIPGVKDPTVGRPLHMKQVCIYAFTFEELRAFAEVDTKTYAERFEDIEILRFLERGIGVRMVRLSGGSLAVDVPTDVQAVEEALSAQR